MDYPVIDWRDGLQSTEDEMDDVEMEEVDEMLATIERLKAEKEQITKSRDNSEREVYKVCLRVADQIRWANDRACEAEEHGDKSGEEAWHGYVNALRWIQTLLPAEPSPAPGEDSDARR
jgi:hypothetical protein